MAGNAVAGHAALAMAPASGRQQRLAIAICVVSLVLFFAAVPFVREPLPRAPAFIPVYQSALFLIDLITAALLLGQFLRLRAAGLLVLAMGYLFDALIIVPHTLGFPGALAPDGLLGGKPQTTAWLYVFWHAGFPLFVIFYALLGRHRPGLTLGGGMVWIVPLAMTAVGALVAALTLLATSGHDLLPVVMQGNDYSLLVSKGISPSVWLLTLIAVLLLWRRDMLAADLWMMLVMWTWLFDIALSAVLGSSRYDLGFYAGRLFGLLSAGFLLVVMLIEMAGMQAETVRYLLRTGGRPKDPPAA
ncbi:MAG: MASE4 domain-containing protein [Alphaproteobacteria bacterium]|nr:MASE4 domain-containing protein [Alphaproteobacteria bacterium]